MKLKTLRLLPFFLWWCTTISYAQNHIQFELLTTNNGLPDTNVQDIAQDDQGFLWVATLSKLLRYDGKKFNPILLPDSTKKIQTLQKGKNNGIWIFHEGDQITHLNTITGKTKIQKNEDWGARPLPPISRKAINGNEVLEFDGQQKIIKRTTLPDHLLKFGKIVHVLFYNDSDVFASNEDNTFTHLNIKKNIAQNYNLNHLIQNPIKKLFQDNTGIIWGITADGLLKVNFRPILFDTYLTGGNQYCGNGFGNCKMRGIAEDEVGNIYLSHYNSIHVLDSPTNQVLPLLPEYKNFNTPFDLVVFQNKLWTNSTKRIDLATKKIKTILPAPFANDFDDGSYMIDKNDHLWLGRKGNLWKYNAQKDQFDLSNLTQNIDLGEITYLLPRENSNQFWIGTNENGLFKMDFEEGVVQNYSTSNTQLNSNFVRILYEDKDQTLWIGTPGGLYKMNTDSNKIERYSVKDGLPNDNINSILTEGDSCFWIGTDLGLSRFHKTKKTFINFFVRDGLPDNEFHRISFHKAKNGRMYFGGLNGVTAFYPEEVMKVYRAQQQKSKVVLTSFFKQEGQKEIAIAEIWNFNESPKIDIYQKDKNYTFEFALTDHLANDEITYSYKLEGYDYDYSTPSKSNSVRYNNLPHGKYTLNVKARDASGGWNPNELSLSIIIHPPWWQSSWILLVYFSLLLAMAFGFYRFLKNRWRLREALRNEHEKAAQLEEVNDFKTRLYANITHEFRTPLTVILGLSEQIGDNVENISAEKIHDHLDLISSNGKNLLHLINQILDLGKLESSNMSTDWIQGDIVAYLKSIMYSFESFAATQKIELVFESKEEKLLMDFDKDKILKIVSNLISNGIKFTNEGGKVKLFVERKDFETLILKVIDTGIGIPKEAVPHIFDRFFRATTEKLQKQIGTGIGLSLVRELVRLFKGKISAESQIGKGTQFIIHLPIHNKAPLEISNQRFNEIQDAVSAYTIWSQATINEIQSGGQQLNGDFPTLLIVEDNMDIITYLKAILLPFYQLNIATNGKIGIEIATEIIPDIIITDVMMPEMDGFEMTNFLKNDIRTSHIPIVMLTARSEIESRLHGLERGADAYLSKPFNKNELLIRLQNLVDIRKKLQARFANFQVQPPSEEVAVQIEDAFLLKLREVVEENLDNPQFGIKELCKAVLLSRMQVHRKLKAISGQTASHFIRTIRLQKARNLLQTTGMNISEIAYEVGFNDPNYFSRTFSQEYGKTPSQFLAEKE